MFATVDSICLLNQGHVRKISVADDDKIKGCLNSGICFEDLSVWPAEGCAVSNDCYTSVSITQAIFKLVHD